MEGQKMFGRASRIVLFQVSSRAVLSLWREAIDHILACAESTSIRRAAVRIQLHPTTLSYRVLLKESPTSPQRYPTYSLLPLITQIRKRPRPRPRRKTTFAQPRSNRVVSLQPPLRVRTTRRRLENERMAIYRYQSGLWVLGDLSGQIGRSEPYRRCGIAVRCKV